MSEPKKADELSATAQEPEAKQAVEPKRAAAEVEAPVEEKDLEGVAGGGFSGGW